MAKKPIPKNTAITTDERLNPEVAATVVEYGRRGTSESQLKAMYQQMQPDFDLYSVIHEVRRIDRLDGSVKQIHNRIARSLTKGGLVLDNPTNNKRLDKAWKGFVERTELDKRQKLISDARGFVVSGNLALQWVLNSDATQVMRAIQMPAETIRPLVEVTGQFKDPAKAYAQYSYLDGKDLCTFAQWQMSIARLDPDNYDDMASLGRPLLDAARKRWRQIDMTQDDLVIRRRHRAPLRTAHILDGATNDDLKAYRDEIEADQRSITTNYYMNKKGAVQAVQGDTNLDQIQDITLLLDSFFSGTILPKSLLGFVTDLSRDVLEDMKREFYEDLDAMQDIVADNYLHGFMLQLLLMGINPDSIPFSIKFAERLTETATQRADRALKVRALGASLFTAWSIAGLDPVAEQERVEEERERLNPYPMPDIPMVDDELDGSSSKQAHQQTVTITPDNAQQGQSATSITNG